MRNFNEISWESNLSVIQFLPNMNKIVSTCTCTILLMIPHVRVTIKFQITDTFTFLVSNLNFYKHYRTSHPEILLPLQSLLSNQSGTMCHKGHNTHNYQHTSFCKYHRTPRMFVQCLIHYMWVHQNPAALSGFSVFSFPCQPLHASAFYLFSPWVA